jgi:hypothetical protein
VNSKFFQQLAISSTRKGRVSAFGALQSPATKPHQENLQAAKEILPAVAIYSNFACPADELEITE